VGVATTRRTNANSHFPKADVFHVDIVVWAFQTSKSIYRDYPPNLRSSGYASKNVAIYFGTDGLWRPVFMTRKGSGFGHFDESHHGG